MIWENWIAQFFILKADMPYIQLTVTGEIAFPVNILSSNCFSDLTIFDCLPSTMAEEVECPRVRKSEDIHLKFHLDVTFWKIYAGSNTLGC